MAIFWSLVCFSVFFVTIIFSKQMVNGIEVLARWISAFIKQDFSAYVDLDCSVNERTLMRKDGTMVTAIEFHGSSQIFGAEEYRAMVNDVSAFISNQMAGVGHDIQIVYQQDSGAESASIEKVLARSRATAERIGLQVDDVMAAEEEVLRRVVVDESIIVIVSTNLAALGNPELIMEERKERGDLARAQKLPPLGFAQNPIRIVEQLMTKHEPFCDEVMALFNRAGKMSASYMDTHDLISVVRRDILPNSTSYRYRPCLPGDKPPASTRNYGTRPWEDIYYPAIWTQACNKPLEEISKGGSEMVLVDGVYHGTVSIDLPPQSPERFENIMRRIRDLPFRVSFRLYNSGMSRFKLSHTLVQFLSFNPKSNNRAIKEAIEAIQEREKGNEARGEKPDPALGLSVTFTTWGAEEKKVLRNMQTISRAIQGWGGCDAMQGCGDPTDLFVSGLPALSATSPARYMLQSGSDVAKMLPLGRPASSWRDGAVVFTSEDGKMLPFQPGSGAQKAWVYLIFATMGSGKSVLLNTIEWGMCVAPGLQKLPMLLVIDVGESVSGLVSLVQSSLPSGRKDEVGYFKIKMSEEYAYNVFDLQLGFEFPHARDRDFLRNFLSIIATPAGQSQSAPMMSELMSLVVDEAYLQKSTRGTPSRYQKGVSAEIDEVIAKEGLSIDSQTTWRELTDDLFKRNRIKEAIMAQRYAVPTLQDIPSVLKSSTINDLFGRTAEGKDLIDIASVMINTAIRDWSFLSLPTRWDISNCRVVGIDLNDVKGHGASGAKQTAVMYAFAQQSAARNYYLHPDILPLCPEEYRDYHRGRIEEILAEVKGIVYDEFHNTAGIEGIRKIVSVDIREGRKWNIMTTLSSQMLDDFDKDAIDNATGIFILGANGNERVVEKCRKTFGLSESAVDALREKVVEPGVGLSIFSMKSGVNTQVFRNHLSPIKMWAFSTTAEDKALRKLLYEAMPASEARKLLAKRFPKGGEFKAYVESERNNMTGNDDDGNVIRKVANEMIAEYRSK